jgi:hypothetical protein
MFVHKNASNFSLIDKNRNFFLIIRDLSSNGFWVNLKFFASIWFVCCSLLRSCFLFDDTLIEMYLSRIEYTLTYFASNWKKLSYFYIVNNNNKGYTIACLSKFFSYESRIFDKNWVASQQFFRHWIFPWNFSKFY